MGKISDSMLFLVTLRKTLCEFVNVDGKISSINKVKTKNFIFNEASDYEVMYLAINGEMPDTKYDKIKEDKLFESVKRCVVENSTEFKQFISEDIIQNISQNLTSLSEYGLSSCPPIADFLMEQSRVVAAAKGIKNDFKLGATPHPYNPNYKAGLSYRAGQRTGKAINFAKANKGKVIGGAILATLIAYAAYKVFKAKFSAAARACKTSPNKQECVKKFKISAVKAQIAQLRSGMTRCNSSKDPVKCKASIQKKIMDLNLKLK